MTEMYFPMTERPAMGVNHYALILNGNVERYQFSTLGIKYQESDLQQLNEKFGVPTVLSRPVVQTVGGAKFEAVEAIWTKQGYTVKFVSSSGRIDSGDVSIESDVAAEAARKAHELRRSRERPL